MRGTKCTMLPAERGLASSLVVVVIVDRRDYCTSFVSSWRRRYAATFRELTTTFLRLKHCNIIRLSRPHGGALASACQIQTPTPRQDMNSSPMDPRGYPCCCWNTACGVRSKMTAPRCWLIKDSDAPEVALDVCERRLRDGTVRNMIYTRI